MCLRGNVKCTLIKVYNYSNLYCEVNMKLSAV